jgi:hypothetical protein
VLIQGNPQRRKDILRLAVAPQVPTTNFPREDIDERDEEEESPLTVKVSILDVKFPDLVCPGDAVIFARRTELRLLARALLELKALLLAKPRELFVVHDNLMVALEVFREHLGPGVAPSKRTA